MTVGSLGLVMYGTAIIRVFLEVLTFRIVDPPEPLPASLADLPMAVMSAMALLVGLIISVIAMGSRGNGPTITGRSLQIGSGVFLMIAAVPLAWGVTLVQASMRSISKGISNSTRESLQGMIQSAEPKLSLGYGILVFSAVLMLLAALAGLRNKEAPQAEEVRRPFGAAISLFSVFVGLAVILLLATIWSNGNAIEAMITRTSATPDPAGLAQNLSSIMNKSLFVFVGLAVGGLVEVSASFSQPLMRYDGSSKA